MGHAIDKNLSWTINKSLLLLLTGTRNIRLPVRDPTNPFESDFHDEVYLPKEIIVRRYHNWHQHGRRSDHYLMVWEGFPFKKDYTSSASLGRLRIGNLCGHEKLVETCQRWLNRKRETWRWGTRGEDGTVVSSDSPPSSLQRRRQFKNQDIGSAKTSLAKVQDFAACRIVVFG